MKTRRDLTKAQFEAACKRQGFGPREMMGYRDVGIGGVLVCAENAGPNRRAQLAYLIQEHDRLLARQEKETV